MTVSKTEKLHKAFDSTTLNSSLVLLNEEQASAFIDTVVDESKILKMARVVKMSKPIMDIAKIIATGDFLKPHKGDRSTEENAAYEIGSDTIQLIAQSVSGNVFIADDEKQDNLEGAALTNHVLGIIIKKIANQLETVGLTAVKKDTVYGLGDMFDGFIKRVIDNGNILDTTSAAIFGSDVRTVKKAKFTKGWKMLPTQFRTPNMKFFAASDTVIDYNDQFDNNYARNEFVNNVLGKELVEVPLAAIDNPVPTATASTTTTTASAKGQKVLNSAASTNFVAGQNVVIGLGTKYEQVRVVGTVGTGTITFTENLTQAIGASLGLAVQTCTLDGTDVLLTTPENLIYGLYTEGMSFEYKREANKGDRYFFKMRLDFQIEEPQAAVLIRHLKNN